jgi:hypothetical protein
MSFLFTSTFSLIEWLAVTGLAQCVLVLVYIIFRVRNWRQAFLTLAYFFVLGCAFALQFSLRLEDYEAGIRLMQWLCWTLSAPLAYLLVLQVAKGAALPEPRQFLVLALVPAAFLIGLAARYAARVCAPGVLFCPSLMTWAASRCWRYGRTRIFSRACGR